jgi:uncharacterized protein
MSMTTKIDARFARFSLRVGHSPIDRWGVFAEERIPRGRMVIEYTGERVTRLQACRRFLKALRRRGPKRLYICGLNRRWDIDGAVGGSGAEIINHSCDPNLKTRRVRGRPHYYSCRQIRKGEELTPIRP